MSFDFPVGIDIFARDSTSSGFSQVRGALSTLKGDVQESRTAILSERDALLNRADSIRENTRVDRLFLADFKQQNQLLFTGSRLVGQVGNAFLRVNQILVNHNLLQQRQTQTAERLEIAQRRLARAVREHGENSIEVQAAQLKVNDLLNEQSKLAQESTIQYITMGVAGTSVIGDISNALQTALLFRFQLGQSGGIRGLIGRIFGSSGARAAVGGGALGNLTTVPVGAATTGLAAKGAAIAGPAAGLAVGALIGTELHKQSPTFGIEAYLNERLAPIINPPREFFGLEPVGVSPAPTEGAGIQVNGDIYVSVSGGSPAGIVEQINREIATRSVIAGRRG
jgi:hypothetical protein